MAGFEPPDLAAFAAGLLLLAFGAGLGLLRVAAAGLALVTFLVAAFLVAAFLGGAVARLAADGARRGVVALFGAGRDGVRELLAAGFFAFTGATRGGAFFAAGRALRGGCAARFAAAFAGARLDADFDADRTGVGRRPAGFAVDFAARGAALVAGLLVLRAGVALRAPDLPTARTVLAALVTVFFAAGLAFARAAGLAGVLATGFADLDAAVLVVDDRGGASLETGFAALFGVGRAGAAEAPTAGFAVWLAAGAGFAPAWAAAFGLAGAGCAGAAGTFAAGGRGDGVPAAAAGAGAALAGLLGVTAAEEVPGAVPAAAGRGAGASRAGAGGGSSRGAGGRGTPRSTATGCAAVDPVLRRTGTGGAGGTGGPSPRPMTPSAVSRQVKATTSLMSAARSNRTIAVWLSTVSTRPREPTG